MEYAMFKEIKEQPAVIKGLVEHKDSAEIKKAAELITKAQKENTDVYLVANGSSWHACLYAKYLFSLKNRLVVNVYDSGEFESFSHNLTKQSVVIIVSQSGESVDAVRQLGAIQKNDSRLIVITNNPQSTLAKAADVMLDLRAGECVAVPSTKGYMAELTIFALLSEQIAGDTSFSRESQKIAADIERIISQEHDAIRSLADRIRAERDMFVLGHSIGLSSAAEGALKLKECTHAEAEAYAGLEFRHGPSSVVDAGTPVFIFVVDYASEEELQQVAGEMKLRGALVIGIGPQDNMNFDMRFDIYDHQLYSTLPAIVPMQLLAFELALARGLNPDTPENVQKVVK